MANSQAQSSYDDEIDLIELIQNLWRKKWLIILCGLLGVVLAVAYALMAKEVWKSTAEVTSPRAQKIQNYLDKTYKLDKILNEEEQDSKDNKSKTEKKINEVFKEFMFTAANQVNQKTFLLQSDYYKKTKDEDSLSAQRQLQKMLDGLKVQVPDEKAKTLRKIYTLSFEADTPQDAQDVLEQYIQDSAKTALQNLNEDVFNQIETSILWRQEEIARFDYQLKQQKQEQIKQYKDALAKAKKAEIKEYLPSAPLSKTSAVNDGDGKARIDISQDQNLYMQGERILNALVEVSNQSELAYPEEYYQLKYAIEQLKALKTELKGIDMFEYQMEADYPLNREKPKRSLIVIIGGLVGGILGVFWALLATAFENRRKQQI